ncbi:MAG: hypothetical protein IJH99_04945 [Eubacterium sp.]|nr:hypothetical protein [Eubacterium sp.]
MKKEYDDDDGRTIADMSFLDGQYRLFRRKKRKPEEDTSDNPQPAMSGEERRMYVKGAMSAALLIGLIFIGGLALAIFLIDLIL